MDPKGGMKTPSYRNVVANEKEGARARRPPFQLSPHLRGKILQDEQSSGKDMEVEAKKSHPKATRTWEPGKCIPQAIKAPRYVINSTRVEEHT
jgi:hypothetical protein